MRENKKASMFLLTVLGFSVDQIAADYLAMDYIAHLLKIDC